MGYTSLQIGEILLKADRTMYKIGAIAYNNMFAENDETLDYQRDIIYIYKKAVEWGDDYYVGTTKLDKIVERLAAYIAVYDYGTLAPVYSSNVSILTTWIPPGAALNDLTDVTITNVLDKQYLRYDASSGQWVNFGAGTTIRSSQAFTATAGQTTFTTTAPFEANLIDVYLNGVKLNTSSYTVFGQHSIILNDAALLGDILDVIIYDPVSNIINPPSQAGNAGKFLTTDGYSLSWADNGSGTVTSVGLTVPTGFSVSNSPVTTSGDIALGFAAGYSLPTTSVQSNWNTAYNRSLTGISITGVTNKTLTLTEQDGSILTATWSDYDTQGVTNVSVNTGTTGTDFNASVINPTTTPVITLNLPDASASTRGALNSTDWATFNAKQAAITLTTTGSSGAATFIGNVLNIPNYGSALSGYVPTSRTLTINGTTYDLSANRTWSVGTVTSVDMSVPTGLAIANNPITTSGTLALTFASGYSIPTTVKQSNWDDAYTFVAAFPTQTGNAGKWLTTNGSVMSWADITLSNYVPTSRTLTINGTTYDLTADRSWTIVAGVSSVTGTAPISASNVSGAVTISISQSSASTDGYLSSTDWSTFNAKQPAGNYITSLTGEATASGPGAASVTLTNSAVIGKVLTGLNVTGGSISATDSILTAFGKIQNQINALVGGLQYQGTWDANTNTPTLTSSVGTNGYFYIVSVAGSTNLNGITDWKVGDWAVFHASSWQKVDNTESVVSVNGLTGAVVLTTTNIAEGTNLYYTDSRARQSISLTTTGTSGAATYDNTTGVLNIPIYQGGVTSFNTRTGAVTLLDTDVTGALGYTPVTNARTLTINGTTFDLTANRTWSVGTVTSVGLSMPIAFNVTSSPVTGSGTLTVTGAGTASQYVRGDGTLGDFPTGGGGGGASVSYYLNGSVNQGSFGGTTYYEMNKTPILGAGTDFSISSNGYIASFITDPNDPALLNIPGGNWNLEFYLSASSGGGTPTFYVELYKYDGTTFTLITSNSTSPEVITGGTSIDAYFTSLSVPSTALTLTDRLAVRIYVTPAGRTITLHTENNHLCQIITTFTTGLTALNGLTAQVQYFATGTSGTDFNISSSTATHTFNIPTASATNRGALSSADWTTFNDKVPATRTLTINSVSYDLSADRSWTIGPTIYSRGLQRFVATAGQTSFTITNGYTVGLVDVYRNGVKLDNSTEFTASNGTTVVLTDAAALNDVIEVYKYGSEYIPNNALRTVNTFTATAAQTTFSVTYSVGLLDVFYNGSKLAAAEYTATNGTTVVFANACTAGDIIEIIAYNYLVNAYAGISGSGNNNYIPKFTSASTIGNSSIQDNGTTITLGTALAGTSATFSNDVYVQESGNALLRVHSNTTSTPIADIELMRGTNTTWGADIYGDYRIRNSGGDLIFQYGDTGVTSTRFTIASTGAATFSSTLRAQDAFYGADGTSTSASIRFYNSNTGLYHPGSDALGIITSGTEKVRITSDGNVGIGTTPSAWRSTDRALQIRGGVLYDENSINLWLGQNYYENSSGNYIYISNYGASTYRQFDGTHYFYTAPSGTTGATATFTERMRINSIGNVGIGTGTGTPDARLHVVGVPSTNGDAAYNMILLDSSAYNTRIGAGISFGGYYNTVDNTYTFANIKGFKENTTLNDYAGALAFTTRTNGGNPTERMRITSGGAVIIGSATYGSSLGQLRIINDASSTPASMSLFGYNNVANNTTYAKIDFAMQTSGTGGNILATINGVSSGTDENSSHLTFSTATTGTLTERMRITSGGTIEIRNGSTVAGEIKPTGVDNDMTINGSRGQISFQINGTEEYAMDNLQFYPTPDNANALGTASLRWTAVYAANGTIQTSDRNEKNNIVASDLGLDYISKLKPVSYNWIKGDNKKHYGLIAQDIEELGIEFGGLNIENGKYALNYSEFISPLIKAIQELNEKIKILENK